MTIRRIILVTFGFIVTLAVAVIVIAHLPSFQRGMTERIISEIEEKTCLVVEMDSLGYRLWPAALESRGIRISDSLGRELTIEAVEASWAWSRLLGQIPRLRSLRIDGIQADALRLPLPCPGDEGDDDADPWTAVAFDQLTITRAGVFGEGGDLSFAWNGLEAQASLVEQELDLHVAAATLDLVRDGRNLSTGPVEIKITGFPENLRLENLEITDGPVECRATGSADGRGHEASAAVSGVVDLETVLHWWNPSTADLVTPKNTLNVEADFGWHAERGIQAQARLGDSPLDLAGVTISRLLLSYADGNLTATVSDPSWGRADVALVPNETMAITAVFTDMNPVPALTTAGIVLPAGFPADLAISGELQGQVSLPVEVPHIKGEADLIARWNGGSSRLQAHADSGLTIARAEIEAFGAGAEASGTIALDGTLDVEGTIALPIPRTTIDHVAARFPEIEFPTVDGGPLTTTLHLTGPLTSPNIQSDIRWLEPEIEGHPLHQALVTAVGNTEHLDWTATLEAEAGRMQATGTASPRSASVVGRWRLDFLDFGALDLRPVMDERHQIEGQIEGSGTCRFEDGDWSLSAEIEGQEIHSPFFAIDRLTLRAEADPVCLSVTALSADVLEGQIAGTGTLCPAGLDGEIQAALRWTDLDPSRYLEQFPPGKIGRIGGRLELNGPLSDPAGSGRLFLKTAPADAPIQTASLLAHLDHGTITIVSDRLDTVSGPLNLDASLPMGDLPRPESLLTTAPHGDWKLHIEGDDLALGPLAGSVVQSDLVGQGHGDLDVRAAWSPRIGGLPQVHLEVDDFEITIADQKISASQPIRLALDDRGVVAAEMTLKGDLNSLVMGGSYDLKQSEIDASISGSLDPDLALLSPIPLTINQPITVRGGLTGPTGDWVGHFTLDHRGGSIEMRDPPLEITDATIEAEWTEWGLEISDGSAHVNRGTVMLGGGWDPQSGQGIVAELEDVTALLPGGIVTRWDGAFAIEPASDHLMEIVGDLSLKYGVWDYPFDMGAAIRGGSDDALPGADDISHEIGLDMEVRGGGGIAVDNNLGQFGVRWNVLTIGGTVAQPQIVGDLKLLPGGVLTAAGKPITIRRGLVQFTGDPMTDPLLEIVPEDRDSWGADGSEGTSTTQASTMAAAGLASGIGAVFGLENTMIRPEEIALETDEDTSTDFSIGQQLSHNTALFLTTDLRNSQKRTTLLQLWRFPSFPGLTLQAMTRTDPNEADAKLLQRFSWGGTQATGDQPRLHKVKLEGEWPLSKRKLRRTTGLVRDQPWDPFFLFLGDIRLEKKLTEQGWPEARVSSRLEGTPERPVAVFTCTPGRHVAVDFEGDSLGKAFRSSLRPLYRFPPFEQAALAEMHRSAMRHLWAVGHPEAEVSITSDGEGTVTVSIQKGPETTLSGPVIEGVPETVEPSLMALLSQPTELTEISRDPTRAERVVRRTLAARGYRDVHSVESWVETRADGIVEVHIRVDPGTQSLAERIDRVGDDPLGLTDSQGFAIKPGMVLERTVIDNAVAWLRNSYRKEGYTQVRVRSQIYEFEDRQWAVLLTLDPGSTATVDRVEISGRRFLSEETLVSRLPIQSGNLFLLDDLDDSVADLATFEPIERVTATTRSVGEKLVVDLDIIEKPRWTGEIGAGWNSDRGATARAGINDNNLFGRGFRLGLRGRVEQDFLQGRIVLALPPLPGGRFSASLNASYTEDVLPAEFEGDIVINEHIREATLEGHYRLGTGLWTRAYYRFTRTRTFEADPFDPQFPLDITRDLAALGGQIVVDRLDNPFDPRQGYSLALDLSWAGDAIGSDTENIRGLLTGSLATEPHTGWTWFQSLRLGAAKPLNEVLDPKSRFFAGGSASIRGFELDSVGPTETLGGITIYAGGEALFVLNEELRFPLWQSLRGAVFVDCGQVWKSWSDASFDLSVGAGVGLRWSTPVGPLWVDGAWPIANRGENSGARFSFGIGRTF